MDPACHKRKNPITAMAPLCNPLSRKNFFINTTDFDGFFAADIAIFDLSFV
ncbi:MAG: hypothetical protein AB1Z38_14065 [Desulfotignum sp.]